MDRQQGHIAHGMMRGNVPKKNSLWTNEELKQAMDAVGDGTSMRKASQEFSIPYSTLREWSYGARTSRKRGAPAVLNPAEERQLVDYLVNMCELGYGLTPITLKLKVYEITRGRWTPFRNGVPGKGWMKWWKKRHPELTLRVAQALEQQELRDCVLIMQRVFMITWRCCTTCMLTLLTESGIATKRERMLEEMEGQSS